MKFGIQVKRLLALTLCAAMLATDCAAMAPDAAALPAAQTVTEEPAQSPEPSAAPAPGLTPGPAASSEPAGPIPAGSPVPELASAASAAPAPDPTAAPSPSPSAAPVQTPEQGTVPAPTGTPAPAATATPLPTPTPAPSAPAPLPEGPALGRDGVQHPGVTYLSAATFAQMSAEQQRQYLDLCDAAADMAAGGSDGQVVLALYPDGTVRLQGRVSLVINTADLLDAPPAQETELQPEETWPDGTGDPVPAEPVPPVQTDETAAPLQENVDLADELAVPIEQIEEPEPASQIGIWPFAQGSAELLAQQVRFDESKKILRSKLPAGEQKIYDLAAKEMLKSAHGGRGQSGVQFSVPMSTGDATKSVFRVAAALLCTYPEDFDWVHLNTIYLSAYAYGGVVQGSFSFVKSSYYSAALESKAQSAALTQARAATQAAAEGEKKNDLAYYVVKGLDEWICANCEYDTAALSAAQNSAKMYYAHTGYGILINHTGVCESYAKAIARMLDTAGIPNLYVTGMADGGYHAWNYVQMPNGKWYVLDCTWNDPIGNAGGSTHICFLCKMPSDHSPKGNLYSQGYDLPYPSISTTTYDYLTEDETPGTPTLNAAYAVKVGDTVTPKVTLTGTDPYYEKFLRSWSVDDSTIATINASSGTVTGKKPGKTAITLTMLGSAVRSDVYVYKCGGLTYTGSTATAQSVSLEDPDGDFTTAPPSAQFTLDAALDAGDGGFTLEELCAAVPGAAPKVTSSNPNVATAETVMQDNSILLTVTGKGPGSSTVTVAFAGKTATLSVKATKRLQQSWFSLAQTEYTYTGGKLEPAVKGKDGTAALTKNTHFTVAYADNINAGTATVTVTGKGNYSGAVTLSFTIMPAPLSAVSVAAIPAPTYNGQPHTPEPKLTYKSKALIKDNDYTLDWSDNTDAGTATVTVAAKTKDAGGSGNFTGTRDVEFIILPLSLANAELGGVPETVAYQAAAYTPEPVVTLTVNGEEVTLEEGRDYVLAYACNVNAAKSNSSKAPTVTVKGINNYSGTASKKFTITPKDISGLDAALKLDGETVNAEKPAAYTGTAITPAVEMRYAGETLVLGRDFTVTWKNNTKVTKIAEPPVETVYATAAVTGKGNYTGTLPPLPFQIGPRDLGEALASGQLTVATSKTVTYNGRPQTPALTVKYNGKTLANGKDYTVDPERDYTKNTNANQASEKAEDRPQVTIHSVAAADGGSGNFSGVATAEFTIQPLNISALQVPALAEKDFVSAAQEKTLDFAKPGESGAGKITPTLKVGGVPTDLYLGQDYEVGYPNNVDAGTTKVLFQGIGNFTGMAAKTFRIKPKDLAQAGITFADTTVLYTGNAIKLETALAPAALKALVTLSDGTPLEWNKDYTLTGYSANKNVGTNTAKVTVKGKGNYTGSVKDLTFTIAPLPLDHVKVTGKTLYSNGSAVKPAIEVYADAAETVAVPASGYEATYSAPDGWEQGADCTVTVKGQGNYCDPADTAKLTATYKLTRAITSGSVAYKTRIPYFGAALTDENLVEKLGLTVTVNKEQLTPVTDYTVHVITDNKGDKGTVKFTVEGNGSYSGSVTRSVSIKALALNTVQGFADKITVTGDSVKGIYYTGSAVKPAVAVGPAVNEKAMAVDTDYTVAYSANVAAGEKAVVKITGKGNYSGTVTKTFTIAPLDLNAGYVNVEVADLVFTTEAAMKKARPAVTVWVEGLDGKEYKLPGGAYDVTYNYENWDQNAGQVVAGEAVTLTRKPKNTNLTDSATTDDTGFIIGYNLKSATVAGLKTSEVYGVLKNGAVSDVDLLAKNDTTYGGKADNVTLKVGGVTFTLSALAERFQEGPGGTITIKDAGKKGTAKVTFSTEKHMITVEGKNSKQETGSVHLFGELTKSITVKVRDLKTLNVAEKIALTLPDGAAITKNTAGVYETDYTAAQIKPTAAQITATANDGSGSYTLDLDTDYKVSWKNNTNAGSADLGKNAPTVVITGIGSYSGTVEIPFTIKPIDLSTLDTRLGNAKLEELKVKNAITVADAVYTGKAVKPAVTVYGVNGKKIAAGKLTYTLAYKDDKRDGPKTGSADVQAIEIGTATVTLTGQGNYTGTVTKDFWIGHNIAKATVPALKQEYVPFGNAVIPDDKLESETFVTYKRTGNDPLPLNGKDAGKTSVADYFYTVTYAKNNAAGTAKVTFTANPAELSNDGSRFVGTVTKNMTVQPFDVTAGGRANTFEILLYDKDGNEIQEMEYTGKACKPDTVEVKYKNEVVEPENYTVAYKNNTKLGTATATLTFKKNYKGKLTADFKVVLPNKSKTTAAP